MFHFASSSLRMKFIILMVGTSLVTVICITALWLQTLRMEARTQLENYRTQLLQDVDTSLKNETQIVVSLLEKVYQQQQAGLLSEPEAKKLAADLVRDLRYDDGKGYFWIDTADGVNVVLLGRDVEGKSRIDLVDPNGVHFIQEMLKNGRQTGGGYTDLSFAKPGETTPLPKRNYTTTFAPYQWVLGTGVWIDQIDALVAAQKEAIDADFYSSLRMTVLVSVLIEALCIALAIFFSNKLATPIAHVTNRLATLAQAAYKLLGLQSYFTAGEMKVKAWTVRIGAKAPEAAGVIHSDFERGFIKAEVASYTDYVELGGEAGCKAAGKLRMEGKEYVVQDGDVMHFRFNV